MKRAVCILLTIVIITCLYIPSFADEAKSGPKTEEGQILMQYFQNKNEGLLVRRNNYGYMNFIEDFTSDALSLYLLGMTDKLINTGSKPDKKKYMETLVNIIAASDLDRADSVAKQKKMDNLKSLKDYALDISEMGKDAVSVMVGSSSQVSSLENELKIAVNGVYTLADNTDNWIEAISNLETITQDYSEHDAFLALIENKSDGELQEAAHILREGMNAAYKIKLDSYADVSEENFKNYEEFFFSDIFFEALKNVPEYEKDESLKFFVDTGDSIISKIGTLGSAWNLGAAIGTLVGDVVVGGENLINRVLEMMALHDISVILQTQVLDSGYAFWSNVGNDNEKNLVNDYISWSNYLIGCRLRGEYCLYSIVAKDAGLLSWFDKESAEEAKAWYDNKTEKILKIQENLMPEENENDDVWKIIRENDDVLKQYANNMELPVEIYTFFHHFSDSKEVNVNDPYTFWMMLSFYATMQMDDEMYPGGSRLAERYLDDEYGQMLILSEEEVRDAVNAMMPGITEYPPFPDIKYEKPYKKDGNYYFSLIDLDAGQAARMTDIEVNDDGTATAIVEVYSHSYSDNVDYVLETYHLSLTRNDKIDLDSPEPYPFCIKSIKAARPEQIETESDGIAQAIWTEADTTLTFYYGPQVFDGDTFKGKTVTNVWSGSSVTDTGNEEAAWAGIVADSVTDVVFDTSFLAVKPTSTHGWFQSFYELSRVDMSGLNTSNVTDMSNMFEGCYSLTSLDLSGFDTSNVTNMSGMFAGIALTTLDLSGFDTSKVLDMSEMFSICSDLRNLNVSSFNTSKVTNMDSLFLACGNLTNLDVSGFNTSSVTNMREMFAECRELTSLDVGSFDTSSAEVMQGMFRSCSNLLTLDVSGFDTSNVTDMYSMFTGCSNLTNIDLSKFDTADVTAMGDMFEGCSSLTNLDVSSFDTSKVTGMGSMFYGCSSLTSLDLNNFDTSNVTEMMHMFGECSNLTSLDLSGFNTSNVENMYRMFGGCNSLISLDLSGFDVSKVTNIDDMFNSCNSLKTIYCKDSSTEWGLFEYSDNMFYGCASLVGRDGSSEIVFDDFKTDSSMAKAASLGGYFTAKE